VKTTVTPAEDLFEMSNLRPKTTGLPFVVWISPGSGNRHDVRVKVSPGPKPKDFVSVALRPDVHVVEGEMSGSDLALLRRWIELNRDVIIKFWDGEIEYHEDAIAAIKPIR
jgi:hypothetical protein